jgi:hypothetical protein
MFYAFASRIGLFIGNDFGNGISVFYKVEKLLEQLLQISAIINGQLADGSQGDWYSAIAFK